MAFQTLPPTLATASWVIREHARTSIKNLSFHPEPFDLLSSLTSDLKVHAYVAAKHVTEMQ